MLMPLWPPMLSPVKWREAQVRAYLVVRKVELVYDHPSLMPHLRIWIENTGQSPAYDVDMAYATWNQDEPHNTIHASPPELCLTDVGTIGAGRTKKYLITFAGSVPDPAAKSESIMFRLEAVLFYLNIFESRNRSLTKYTIVSRLEPAIGLPARRKWLLLRPNPSSGAKCRRYFPTISFGLDGTYATAKPPRNNGGTNKSKRKRASHPMPHLRAGAAAGLGALDT